MEQIVLELINQANEMYHSKECKEKVIHDVVESALIQNLKENKISSEEYQSALNILKNAKL